MKQYADMYVYCSALDFDCFWFGVILVHCFKHHSICMLYYIYAKSYPNYHVHWILLLLV